jgi:hypothetical protein
MFRNSFDHYRMLNYELVKKLMTWSELKLTHLNANFEDDIVA